MVELTSGTIIAVDSHAPSIGRLRATVGAWLSTARVKMSFEDDYPTMGRVPYVPAAIERRGLSLIDHFTLPDEAWWDDFYTPMRQRIEELRSRCADEAIAVLDQLAQEPEMHQWYLDYYAYEFFVARRLE